MKGTEGTLNRGQGTSHSRWAAEPSRASEKVFSEEFEPPRVSPPAGTKEGEKRKEGAHAETGGKGKGRGRGRGRTPKGKGGGEGEKAAGRGENKRKR